MTNTNRISGLIAEIEEIKQGLEEKSNESVVYIWQEDNRFKRLLELIIEIEKEIKPANKTIFERLIAHLTLFLEQKNEIKNIERWYKILNLYLEKLISLIKMVEKLEILVIEDTPEYLAIAQFVYSAEPRINVHYATTYEQAMAHLQTHKVHGVVSDLFFPSQINWRDRFLPEVRLSVANDIKSMSGKEMNEFRRKMINDFRNTLRNYELLNENPSGLGIAVYCLEKDIPFIIASQGEKHGGNLAIVRFGTFKIPFFKDRDYDFERMVLYGGQQTDKSNPQTWKDALYHKYSPLSKLFN